MRINTRALAEQSAAESRAADAARLGEIYGKLLPDVLFLRGRDNSVMMDNGRLVLNGKVVTADELRERAARDRRLARATTSSEVRHVTSTASGLEVGKSTPHPGRMAVSAEARRVLSPVKEKMLSGAAATARAKAEQASEDIGPAPRLDWLPLDQLSVDRRYQRDMGKDNWAQVNRIVREWTWLHYQPIVVAPAAEGEGFVVIDGQHRLEAARKHPKIDRLPCYIVDAPDVAMQARAFVALNARRIGVTRLQRFWAAHAAGEATARKIHKVCTEAGVAITKTGGLLPPRTTFATFTIEKLLPLGGRHVTTALKIIGEAHGDKPDVFKSSLIFAATQIVAAEPFVRRHLVEALASIAPDALTASAKTRRARHGGSMEKAMQHELQARYANSLLLARGLA